MKKIILRIYTLVVLLICTLSTNAQWQQVNNGLFGGGVSCMATNGANIFAGTAYGGIYLSTDTGKSWKAVNNGLAAHNISALAVLGSTIFAATDDNQNYDAIFLSANNGANWTPISDTLFIDQVTALGIVGNRIFASGNGYIYFSDDMGATWKQSQDFVTTDINSICGIGNTIMAGDYHSAYISYDTGATWNYYDIDNAVMGVYFIKSIGGNIYAGSENGGLYMSKDTGATWITASNGIYDSLIEYYDVGIYALATSGSNFFAGTDVGVFLSTDSGINWRPVNNGLLDHNTKSVVTIGTEILAGTDNRIFSSGNNGANWTEADSGFCSAGVSKLDTNGTIICGFIFEPDYLIFSADSGNHWSYLNNIPDSIFYFLSTALLNGRNIYLGTETYGIYVSTDSGVTWVAENNGLLSLNIDGIVASGSNIIATTDSGIFISSNNGANWLSPSGLPLGNSLYSIVVNATKVIGVGGNDSIYASADNGANWSFSGISPPFTIELAVNGNGLYSGSYNNIFVSRDNGVNWNKVGDDFPFNIYYSYWATSISFSGSKIIAATWNGVYTMDTINGHWIEFNEGLDYSRAVIESSTITATEIFIGTSGAGIWKRPISDLPQCGSYFTLASDSTQLHHYIVTNYAYGKNPVSYDWNWGDGTHDYAPYPSHTYADSGFYNICLSITDSSGCQSTFCDSSFHAMRTTNTMVYVNVVSPLVTGSQPVNSKTPQITIYPNPATNQLTIHTSYFHEAATVSIMNVLGQEASPPTPLQRRGEDAVIDVSKLPAGMYFVQLISESGKVVKKFVKAANTD